MFRVEDHLLVEEQHIDKPVMPPYPLLLKEVIFLRDLGPAVGIEGICDFVLLIELFHVAPYPDHELHVLSDGVLGIAPAACEVASHVLNPFFSEEPECP